MTYQDKYVIFIRTLALIPPVFVISSFITQNMDLGGKKYYELSANTTNLVFDIMSVPVYATNCQLYFLYVNGNAKILLLLINDKHYAMPKYGGTHYAGLK